MTCKGPFYLNVLPCYFANGYCSDVKVFRESIYWFFYNLKTESVLYIFLPFFPLYFTASWQNYSNLAMLGGMELVPVQKTSSMLINR